MMREIRRYYRVVVGVDGSANSASALQWAAGEASCWGRVELWAVYAWRERDVAAGPGVDKRWLTAGRVLHSTVSAALGEVVPVRVRELLDYGDPVSILARYATRADLLVLGSHERRGGTPTAVVAGRIARGCRRHSSCPVVMVSPTSSGEHCRRTRLAGGRRRRTTRSQATVIDQTRAGGLG